MQNIQLELSEEVEGSKGTTDISYVFDVHMTLIQNDSSYLIFYRVVKLSRLLIKCDTLKGNLECT